jgi:hypothetical protein
MADVEPLEPLAASKMSKEERKAALAARKDARKEKKAGGSATPSSSAADLASLSLDGAPANDRDKNVIHRTVTGVLTSRPTSRDIKIDCFSMGLNGAQLIQDCSIELTIGRRRVGSRAPPARRALGHARARSLERARARRAAHRARGAAPARARRPARRDTPAAALEAAARPKPRVCGPDLTGGTFAAAFVAPRRYGLLGQNGCGKTNFLQCLANREARAPTHARPSLSASQEYRVRSRDELFLTRAPLPRPRHRCPSPCTWTCTTCARRLSRATAPRWRLWWTTSRRRWLA